MKNSKLSIALLGVSFLLISCAKKEASSDAVAFSVESAMQAVAKISDDNDETTAFSQQKSLTDWGDLIQGKICDQAAVLDTCDSGSKRASYDGCNPLFSLSSLSGQVELQFSDNSCDLSQNGQSVQRTYDLTFTTRVGQQLIVQSSEHADYRGNTLSGGGRLTRTGTESYDIEILGQHRQLKSTTGRTLIDVSVRTTSPVQLQGTLRRANRHLDGGAIEVIHNRAKFTTTLVPRNLKWASGCCYPIEGEMNISFADALSGSGVVTFSGCGAATLKTADEERELSFNECE